MAAGARSLAASRIASTPSGSSAILRIRLMIRPARRTMPATRTGASSRRARGGAINQRRTTTTVVIVARARPPYRPVLLSAMIVRLVEYRTLRAVAPTARIAMADPIDARLQLAARIGEHEREQEDRGRILERQRDFADERDPGLVERPDEPGEPDQGHQPAGPVGRLVVPDRQPAVEVGQADREMQQTGACGLAGAHRDRLARHGPQRARGCRSQAGVNVRS